MSYLKTRLSQGYEYTGEQRAPQKGELYVSDAQRFRTIRSPQHDPTVYEASMPDGEANYAPTNWIVRAKAKTKYTFAVDWDGTCVENRWPKMGDWLPGAVDALRRLCQLGHVVIHTCRIAPVEFETDSTWRHPHDIFKEVEGIYEMLENEALYDVEVWTKPWKPPALVYIDDRAIRYVDWEESLLWVEDILAQVAA